MKRRGFLGLLGLGAATTVLPKVEAQAEPPPPEGRTEFSADEIAGRHGEPAIGEFSMCHTTAVPYYSQPHSHTPPEPGAHSHPWPGCWGPSWFPPQR